MRSQSMGKLVRCSKEWQALQSDDRQVSGPDDLSPADVKIQWRETAVTDDQ
jgi:hypothetical protein